MTIIGVNPPEFTGAYGAQRSPQVFLPFSMQPIVAPFGSKSLLINTELWWVMMMARVHPGVTTASTQAQMNAVFQAAVRAEIPVKANAKMPTLLLHDGSRGQNGNAELSKPIYVLVGLAGFVLLLACANLANLLLARSSARQREMSVRLAMGAGRRRILRQMLTESLLLSTMGGAAGLLLAYGARNVIPRLLADPWGPPAFNATFDWGIFAFTAAVSVVTGLVFGLAPAWQATRVNVSAGLKEAAQTTTHRRRGLGGKAIVVVQVALSMLLLIGAGLFVRTLVNLNGARLGFRPDDLLLFDINPPGTRYPAGKDVALHRVLEEKLASVPGVEGITLSQNPMIAGSISNGAFTPSGTPKTANQRYAEYNAVGERFFATMGIPIVEGRGFNDGDSETSRKVAVINRTLAAQFFPKTNPLGQTFRSGEMNPQLVTIVGICGDAHYDRVQDAIEPTYYMPYRQHGDPEGGMGMTYEISTRLKQDAIVPSLRAAVQSVDRNLPLADVRTQKEQIAATMQQERILADLTAGFGLVALLLASIGIYGIMAYAVARRTNEIGIRMALGAQPGRVLRSMLGEASWMVVLGAVVGPGRRAALGRLIASLLYGLKAWDPATLAGSAAFDFYRPRSQLDSCASRCFGRSHAGSAPRVAALLVAQRYHRIHADRTPGREERRQQRYAQQQQRDAAKRDRIEDRHSIEQVPQKPGDARGQHQPDAQSKHHRSRALPQDQQQHIASAGAQCHANAYLPRALHHDIAHGAVDADCHQQQAEEAGGHRHRRGQR